MKKESLKLQHFIGLRKSEVFSIRGNEHNDYSLNVWVYHLRNTWIGKKVYLIIEFEDGRVSRINIVKSWL